MSNAVVDSKEGKRTWPLISRMDSNRGSENGLAKGESSRFGDDNCAGALSIAASSEKSMKRVVAEAK